MVDLSKYLSLRDQVETDLASAEDTVARLTQGLQQAREVYEVAVRQLESLRQAKALLGAIAATQPAPAPAPEPQPAPEPEPVPVPVPAPEPVVEKPATVDPE